MIIVTVSRKFEPSSAAPAVQGEILKDLPVEVALLFGAILLVGVAGLVKQSGVLTPNAPTVGLGESRDELAGSAAAAKATDESLSQAEQEKKYFAILAEEQKQKRGGSSDKRKKKKKSR